MDGDSDVIFTSSNTVAEKVQTEPARLLTFDSVAAGAVTSVIGWTTLYYLFCAYSRQHTREWHCRMVTVIHAVIVVLLSAWSVFVQGPWPFTEAAGPNTPLHKLICTLSFGYFTFDFCWCLYYQSEGAVMIFHHMLSIFGNGFVLYRGINGTELVATLFGTEITNPVLQLRWFLRYTGVSARSLAIAATVDFSFLILFTVMRLGIGSVLLYSYLLHPAPDWIARSAAVIIYGLSWMFWYAIVRYAVRKYGHKLNPFGKNGHKRDNLDNSLNAPVG